MFDRVVFDWPAVALAGPLLVAAAIAVAAVRGAPLLAIAERQSLPPPYFRIPGAGLPARAWSWVSGLRLPPDYRSLFSPPALEAAAQGGRPWLWIALTAFLALLLLR